MKPTFIQLKPEDYITHIEINGARIIPSDSFELAESEYILLEILKSSENIIYLKIMALSGDADGEQYIIPKHEFEKKTSKEIQENLINYKIN